MSVLTEAQVLGKARVSSQKIITDLASIKNLNLWGQNLTNVDILERLPYLEVLSLAINSLTTLYPFRNLTKVTELYLRRNNISDIRELHYLRDLKQLRVLWLSENPVATLPKYRATVIRLLPQLRKLDDRDIADKEREMAVSEGVIPDLPHVPSSPSRQGQSAIPGDKPGWLKERHQEQHLRGAGMEVITGPPRNPDGRGGRGRRQEDLRTGLYTDSALLKEAHPPDERHHHTPQHQRESHDIFIPHTTKLAQSPPSSRPLSSQVQKRRPTWLVHKEQSGQVKDRIRAASLDAQVAEESVKEEQPPKAVDNNDDYEPTRANNILFAVLSLIKELDCASLRVVAHEIQRASNMT
ncbi:hypothetical protein DFS34DRAFT_144033 [Phlyctochytrium arcticum]|nr:hypothetical protein DFS34DRAFT_144033 [Phlyctochytrium arcticum]